jgi:5'-methylthioadenosine phosphorylase
VADFAEITDREELTLTTPFGDPSGPYILGVLSGQRVAFLARHGRNHNVPPSAINSRANVFGMKMLGVQYLLSTNAVGSLRHDIEPLSIVLPDQFVDQTRGRPSSFFLNDIAAHVTFARPVCRLLNSVVLESGKACGALIHRGGTYVCVEGPQFSTLAESHLYRAWGLDIIGMTALPEARLAREAEMCYTAISLVTDYDSWHPDRASVTADMIQANAAQSVLMATRTISTAVANLPYARLCECSSALSNAVITRPNQIPEHVKTALAPLLSGQPHFAE